MKKSWIVLVAVFVVILTVAAAVAAQDAAPSGVVRVGSWDSGDSLTPFNDAIASFEAAFPDIDIQLESVPQDYGTKLLAQFASGDAPDIFQTGDGDTSRYVNLGAVENLDSYIDGPSGFDRAELYPGVAAFGVVNDGTYYLTKDYSPLVLYYNKDHFDAAGIAYPTADWTWDDFVAAAQKLTLDGNGNDATSPDFDPNNIQRWGVQIPNSWGDTVWPRGILPIINAGGGSLISEDGTTTTGYMNGDATVAALQRYVDLFETHRVAPTKTDVASFAGVDMFAQQIVSMMWTGRWPLDGYLNGDSALTFNFGTTQLPEGPEGRANALCWAGFAMYSGSENKDAAWEFLKYIGVGDGAEEFAEYALTDVVRIVEAQGLDTDPYNASIIADLEFARPIPELFTPNWLDCGEKFFKQELETVMEGDVTVQDAMDLAASEADACLAEAAGSS
jgi:multiple sugar transport system substrate-binding protein